MNRNKIRVVHIEDYFNPTAGYQVNQYIKYNKDVEHIIVSSYDLSPFYKEYSPKEDKDCEDRHNVSIIRLKTRLKLSQRLWLKGWSKQVDALSPDIVFMHSIGDFKDIQLWMRRKKYVIVRDCHMSWVASRNLFAPLFMRFFAFCFAPFINHTEKYFRVYALGTEEKQYLLKLGIHERKIKILPHGFDPDDFYYSHEERVKTRKELNIDQSSMVISYIGKFDNMKQPHLLFECLNLINDQSIHNAITLLFAGPSDADYMKKVFEPVQERLRIKVRTIHLASIPAQNLRRYYCASDICFWPKETTLSSIHAQACGRRVVMEAQESNKERVVHQENLYRVNDLNHAAQILTRLINERCENDDSTIQSMAQRNNNQIMRNLFLDWQNMVTK